MKREGGRQGEGMGFQLKTSALYNSLLMRILPDHFVWKGPTEAKFLGKQSCRSLVVEEQFSPGMQVSRESLIALQAIEHDVNNSL